MKNNLTWKKLRSYTMGKSSMNDYSAQPQYGGTYRIHYVPNVGKPAFWIVTFTNDKRPILGEGFSVTLDKGDNAEKMKNSAEKHYREKVLPRIFVGDLEEPMGIIRGNPAPAGYHYMPDGRLMADSAHRNPTTAARLRRQAEILEMDERLVPSTLTYEDIKDDPKLIAHYKKIMTPMAWKQLVDDWIRSGVRSGSGRRDFVIPKESEYRRMVSENPVGSVRKKSWRLGEYAIGGIIEAKVLHGGDAVVIRNTDQQTGEMIDQKIFRWPLDKFKMYVYLNELTTGYYADKISDWINGSIAVGNIKFTRPNPAPFYAHGLQENKGRKWWGKKVTHGLNAGELRALYKLVKKGHWEAKLYAQRKLEIPPSETKAQILAIIDHHIRDLAGK